MKPWKDFESDCPSATLGFSKQLNMGLLLLTTTVFLGRLVVYRAGKNELTT
jgi:hypothetical protein